MKLHQGKVFIDDMVNSTDVVVDFKTNFVKVVQNQFCSGNHWCCTPTDNARSSCDLS